MVDSMTQFIKTIFFFFYMTDTMYIKQLIVNAFYIGLMTSAENEKKNTVNKKPPKNQTNKNRGTD